MARVDYARNARRVPTRRLLHALRAPPLLPRFHLVPQSRPSTNTWALSTALLDPTALLGRAHLARELQV